MTQNNVIIVNRLDGRGCAKDQPRKASCTKSWEQKVTSKVKMGGGLRVDQQNLEMIIGQQGCRMCAHCCND